MGLPKEQLQRISKVIRDAYTQDSLAQMVRVGLGERLFDIVADRDFTTVVFDLVEWAERQGRVPELVGAAHADNPQNPDLAALAAAIGEDATGFAGQPRAKASLQARGLWFVPFERGAAFFGREEDLARLHAALSAQSRVGIRPAGVTGLGGIGKTQLAVEYAYLHRGDYASGVFWLNGAAADWRAEFAALGVYLQPELAGQGQAEQMRAAADYLAAHPDCLLVLDNVEDPNQLRQPIGGYLVPSALPCALLFTTRRQVRHEALFDNA